MGTLPVEIPPLAQSVEFTDDDLVVSLADGRRVVVPLVWFPRLSHATKTQLENYEILGDGEGIHWLEIDEDLSVAGLLRGSHEQSSHNKPIKPTLKSRAADGRRWTDHVWRIQCVSRRPLTDSESMPLPVLTS